MNKVILIGRITKDLEVKLTSNQTKYVNFTIAVDRKFKDADGNRQTDFINCVAWKQTADFISKYFKKGSRIGVSGSIQTRSYDKDGQKVFITEVNVEDAEFVESKADSQPAPSKPVEPSEPADLVSESTGNLPFEL